VSGGVPGTEWVTEAAALLQLGRHAKALAALEHGEELVGGGAVRVVISTSPKLSAEYAGHSARAHHDLGEIARAIRHLEAAQQVMREFMYDGEEPWIGTPLVRAYRVTAARLGR